MVRARSTPSSTLVDSNKWTCSRASICSSPYQVTNAAHSRDCQLELFNEMRVILFLKKIYTGLIKFKKMDCTSVFNQKVKCDILIFQGKKNKVRVYYLAWLRNKILHNDPEVEKKQGWTTVGEMEGCVHYKVGK